MINKHISRFKKHLGTNNEWFVVTDQNMNVLSAQEGDPGSIPYHIRDKAYSEARAKLPLEGGWQDIYAFHSHPKHYGIAAQSPSKGDLRRATNQDPGANYRGLNIRAEGVMTRRGTNVIEVDPTRRTRYIPNYYDKQLTTHLKEEADARGITKENYKSKTPRELVRMANAGLNKAFTDTQEKYPEIKTEFIKREIIRPSDVRPHTVPVRGPQVNTQPSIPLQSTPNINSVPTNVGEFGKPKKKKSKKWRTFYGI